MKKRVFILVLILILGMALIGCADKKPAAPQETAPQGTVQQGTETRTATVIFFAEPVNFLAQEGAEINRTNIVFDRKRAACIDEIDRINSILQNVDTWSADTAAREELYVDGGFCTSDDDQLYYFSPNSNTVFYEVLSMDHETEKVNVEFYFAELSAADMEYLRSLKDSTDGYRY